MTASNELQEPALRSCSTAPMPGDGGPRTPTKSKPLAQTQAHTPILTLPSKDQICVRKQMEELRLKSKNGAIKDLYRHFTTVEGYQHSRSQFYHFLKTQYNHLFVNELDGAERFDPRNYYIDENYELETPLKGLKTCLSRRDKQKYTEYVQSRDGWQSPSPPVSPNSGKIYPANASRVGFSPSKHNKVFEFQQDDVVGRCPTPTKHGTPTKSQLKKNKTARSGDADKDDLWESMFAYKPSEHPVEYPHASIKGIIRKLFVLCGFPQELAEPDDLLFNLETLGYAIATAQGNKLDIVHEREKEIRFLRNLARDLRQEFARYQDALGKMESRLDQTSSRCMALESERDLLEKTLCDYQVREEVTQAREERLRRVVEENIHLKNEILYLGAETSRGSHEDLESCKRKVTHYNYQLTRQEELNRRLAEELEDSRSKVKKCEELLDRNEKLESQICELERVCRGKDNHLAALEREIAANRQRVEEVEKVEESCRGLERELALLKMENVKLNKIKNHLKYRVDSVAVGEEVRRNEKEAMEFRLEELKKKYVCTREDLSFYQEECEKREKREYDHHCEMVKVHNDYQREIFQWEAKYKQLVDQYNGCVDTAEYYKDRLEDLEHQLETVKKSKHERFKETFMSSSLFLRSKSASASASVSASPLSPMFSPATGVYDENRTVVPKKSTSLTSLLKLYKT